LLLRSWIKESSSCSCHVSEQLESSIKEQQQITTTKNYSSEAQRQIKEQEQEQEQITTIVTTTNPSSLRNLFLGDKRTRRNNLR
jgi:translation initiation factor 2B subunit (eIF-2B alpha/beta/delta family)